MIDLPRIRQFVRASGHAVRSERPKLLLLLVLAFTSSVLESILLFILATLGLSLSATQRVPTLMGLPGGSPLRIDMALLPAIAAALVLGILLLAYPIAMMHAGIGARIVQRARERMARAFLFSSIRYRHSHADGTIQLTIVEFCHYLSVSVQHFIGFCINFTTLIALLLVPTLLNPKLAAALVLVLPAGAAMVLLSVRRLRHDSSSRADIIKDLANEAGQFVRVADDIQAFHIEHEAFARLSARIAAASEAMRRLVFQDYFSPAIFQFAALGALILTIWGTMLAYPGQHPSLAVLALLMLRILSYARQALAAIHQGSGWAPYVEVVFSQIAAAEAAGESRSLPAPSRFTGLVVDAVDFAYSGGNAVLEAASFKVEPGEVIGIVGPSGSGKSTLCGLLLGIYRPDRGSVTIGGASVALLNGEDWAQLAAYVPQDYRLIGATVADNIRFFRSGHGDADVEHAARQAHIHDDILALPEGYSTLIGPGGAGLSGGQRQRLVIARALLDRPALLVLDEASSALDERSEALVMKTLTELSGNMTIVLVTHRRSMLDICTRILTVEKRKIWETRAESVTLA